MVSLGEIHYGIELLASGRKQSDLRRWLSTLRSQFLGSILPIDDAVAIRWGQLKADGDKRGRKLPMVDSLLAATALRHNLTLVTGNVRDFHTAGLKILNPK